MPADGTAGKPVPGAQAERLRATIRRLATERGLTLAELGRLIGMRGGNSFYNLLNGWSDSLSAQTLIRVADVFAVSLDDLTGRHPALRGTATPAPADAQIQAIAAACAEAAAALATAREAVAAAEQRLRAAAALLPSPASGSG
jgi:transcriptional regulator with XRE-family HTH domain